MKLEKSGKWYILHSTYEERAFPKECGFWWNTRAFPKLWSSPKIEAAFKARQFADDALKAEIETEMSDRSNAVNASKAVNADIDIPCPIGLSYLPFQKAAVAYAATRQAALFADEMGLGKTVEALAVINKVEAESVLVICPASLRINWLREAQKWLVNARKFYVVDNPAPVPAEADFVICNYDRLDVDGLDREWSAIIVDEAHYLKNQKAKRTKAVLGESARKDTPRVSGLVDRAKIKLFLTGTPVLNRPVELFPLLSALDPEGLGRNFFAFAKRYCGAVQGPYGWNFGGASNLAELQVRLREKVMIRRLKQEVLKELPAKRRQLVAIPANGSSGVVAKELAAYEKQEERIAQAQAAKDLAWSTGNDSDYKEAVRALREAIRQAFTEIAKARHETALAKVEKFVDFAKDSLENTDKIVIFGHHHDVIDRIEENLSDFSPVKITGNEKLEERQAAVDRFQNDPACRVIIGSIGAMGVGLTLTASSTVLFAELDWTPANMTQAEDRLHRIGQDNAVSVIHVVLDGSLDQRMATILIEKQEIADKALDKGAEYLTDLEAQSPAVPAVKKPRKTPEYKDQTKEKVLKALQQLAGVCDGAVTLDGQGFNKFDAPLGHRLANLPNLNDRQCWLGLKLCRKYRKQLAWMAELDEPEAE